MKHAFQLASLSVAAFALSANAGIVTTFNIDFEDGTVGSAPTAAASVGTWSVRSGESAIATAGGNKYLEVDAPTNSATSFEPTATGTSKIAMDVKFVGASEDPTTGIDKSTTQAALYLRRGVSTTNLYLSVAGGNFVDTGLSVVEDDWYRVEIKFEYGTRTGITVSNLTTHAHASYTTNVVANATGVQGVDFFGSGKVDNFIGQYAEYENPIPMSSSTSSSSDGSSTNTTATISNGYLNPNFAATYGGDAIKFIKVEGTIDGVAGQTRILRVVGGNQNIAVQAAGFDSISKVVAYYGNDVTATNGVTVTTTPAVASNGAVTGTVTAKSGLYYAVESVEVANGTTTTKKTPLNNNTPVAPEAEGEEAGTLPYSVDPSSAGYGVVKFKIVASDDPVTTP